MAEKKMVDFASNDNYTSSLGIWVESDNLFVKQQVDVKDGSFGQVAMKSSPQIIGSEVGTGLTFNVIITDASVEGLKKWADNVFTDERSHDKDKAAEKLIESFNWTEMVASRYAEGQFDVG